MQRWFYLLVSGLFLTGCVSQRPIYPPLPKLDPAPAVTEPKAKQEKHIAVPKPPKKVHALKEVQDQNFDPDYMYPVTHVKKHTVPTPKTETAVESTPAAATTTMGRDECIAMLGQAKFDKYTQMLGSESASIKRCVMMQSMK